MSAFLVHLKRYDWLLTGAVLLLISFGLISLFSLADASAFPYFQRQAVWVVVGLFLMVASSFIDFRLFRTQGYVVLLFYIIVTLLLVLVLLADSRVRGIEAWLKVGGVAFQPVELVKLALIILLAKFFS